MSLSGRSFVLLGGGVVGLSLARALAKRGGDVLLLEARKVGGGASGAAAGVLRAPEGGRSLLARLARGAHDGYERFIEELERESGAAIEFRRSGFADVASSAAAEAELRRRLAEISRRGAQAEWLEPPALRKLAPGLAPQARGALFTPEAMWVNPRDLVLALRRSAERLGVRIVEGFRARLARPSGVGTWEVRGGSDDEPVGGRQTILTTGAWTSQVLEEAGSAPVAPIRPIRGQLVEAEYGGALGTILRHGDVYLIPRPRGTLWAGATVEDVGFDEATTQGGVDGLLRAARETLPDLGSLRSAWAGLRPKLLRRGGPLFGEGDPPVLAGHYRSGIHLGPLTAHLLAARLAGDRDVAPFTFDA